MLELKVDGTEPGHIVRFNRSYAGPNDMLGVSFHITRRLDMANDLDMLFWTFTSC